MKKNWKNITAIIVSVIVFFIQFVRRLYVPHPKPGEIPSGAANEPLAVFISAIMAAILAYALLQGLFWLHGKFRVRLLEKGSKR